MFGPALKALAQFFWFVLKELIIETSKGLWESRPWKKIPPKPEPKRCVGECTPWNCHECRERLIKKSQKHKR